MPPKCSVCEHPERAAIDEALVAGVSSAKISGRYRTQERTLDERAIRRHRANHLPAKLVMAEKAKEVLEADTLLDQVRNLQSRAYGILDKAEGAGDLRTALGAIREARGNLELLAKLLGELDERPQLNILVAPQVQYVILSALEPYPTARLAVAEALRELDA